MASNLSRMGSGINQTPKSSPHSKSSPFKSPIKASSLETKLKLKKIIGATVHSNNAFDCLESAKCFAFTAGAAAVVATVNEDCIISQRFFQARPGAPSLKSTTPLLDFGNATGGPQRSRSRPAPPNRSRDAGNPSSYFSLPIRDSVDAPSNKKPSVREKIKATTCVSLSPDGRLLAVGETGHKPRVLIYSICSDAATDLPITTLVEHTFGIRCVAFSPDSQYLATLGELNDGFLHVWSINSRTGAASLYASNKCTTQVKNLIWLDKSLITVGTRHVKIWRIETEVQEPPQRKGGDISLSYLNDSGRALAGRNCLLGQLLDQTFTDAVAISSDRAVICSDQGDICMLVDAIVSPLLVKIADAGFNINSVAVKSGQRLVVAGGGSMAFTLSDLLNTPITPSAPVLVHGTRLKLGRPPYKINAMAFMDNRLVTMDTEMGISLFEVSNHSIATNFTSLACRLEAHGSPIMGLQSICASKNSEAAFCTWSADGLVLFWDYRGNCTRSVRIPLDQSLEEVEYANELKVVRMCRDSQNLVSGDRVGRIRISTFSNEKIIADAQAHTGEVTDISIHESDSSIFIASSGRDRMVQIHRLTGDELELIQTLDEHVGSVHKVLFNIYGTHLFSCSSDRNVVVWDTFTGERKGLAFLKARNIVLKSTPLAISLGKAQEGTFLVSTNDRQVLKYEVRSGSLISRFKLSDSEGDESIVMSMITQIPLEKHDCVIAGVSNTDKSIRIYDESGRLLACEYGHTEGLTGVIMIEDPEVQGSKSIVTAGADGTVFLWDLSSGTLRRRNSTDAGSVDSVVETKSTIPATRAPLRRVLSSSEIARLQELRATQDDNDQGKARAGDASGHSRRPSKLSFSQTPDGKMSTARRTVDSPTSALGQGFARRGSVQSCAVVSSHPKEQTSNVRSVAPSTPGAQEVRSRGNSLGAVASSSELNALVLATQQVCRNLHNYRKKLSTSQDVLPVENARDLERELGLTAKVIAEKAARSETAMVKLLDEYSERLVGLLDEKIEASVARQIGRRMERSSDSGDEGAPR